MTWVRLDDQFADHPKVVGLSAKAFRLHVTAICYAARQETDGVIPRGVAFVVAARKWLGELTSAGLWEDHPSGYVIHDYLEYNPSADEVRSKRNSKAMAGARGAAARWHSDPTWQNDAPVNPPSRPLPDPGPARSAREAGEPLDLALTAFEECIGTVTKPVLDELVPIVDEHGAEWVVEACAEAARQNKRSWSYVSGIIRRWKVDGFKADTRKRSNEPATEQPVIPVFDFEAAERARDEAEARRKARAQ